ncbi:MAG: DUF885 domain-containing protein [Candidatus Aminicenantaceae bacterium]
MKRIIVVLTLIVLVLMSIGLLLSQQNQEDTKFKKILDSYLDETWKFFPTSATQAGYHKYDNKLEDLSGKNIENRHEALDKFNQEFVTKVDSSKLSPENQIDHEIMMDALELELLDHESLIPWEYNPVFYNDIIINSVRSLLTNNSAPLNQRIKNATERLEELPKLIKQANENLKTPPQIFTEIAINQFPGILNFYRTELPNLLGQAPPNLKSKAQSAAAKVIPALEGYQNFLKNSLLPKSTGNFRLGGQTHARFLRLTLKNSIPLEELIARARADYSNIRREMFLVAISFYKIMFPHVNIEQLGTRLTQEQVRNTVIEGVLDKIKGEHVAEDEFINKIKTTADEIKNFILKDQLIELPQESLNIEPMPIEKKGTTLTSLIIPGAYETSSSYTCQVASVPEDWEKEKIDSLLEEYNNFLIYFWTIRDVYPGQFVSSYYTKKFPSLLRNLLPNKPLIKGWPVYIEEMLIESGFGNYDLRLRLNQLKLYLRAVVDFLIEFNIHEGSMTKEQAIDYMVRGGFQSQTEAERKWANVCLNPGDSVYTYVGIQEILDIEKEYAKLKGNSFSQKEFLQKLLSYGALPIRHLKSKIIQ